MTTVNSGRKPLSSLYRIDVRRFNLTLIFDNIHKKDDLRKIKVKKEINCNSVVI